MSLHCYGSIHCYSSIHCCSGIGTHIYSKGLVTNYGEGGGATKREGGHVKFYPYEKGVGGGGGKCLSHSKGGAQKVLG